MCEAGFKASASGRPRGSCSSSELWLHVWVTEIHNQTPVGLRCSWFLLQAPRAAGSQSCKFPELQVPRAAGSQSCKFPQLQVPRAASSECCKFPELQVPTAASSHSCKFPELQVPNAASSQSCKFPELSPPRYASICQLERENQEGDVILNGAQKTPSSHFTR
ncbi:unnamed protein product [Pleuronectes platessa]|uniref:Uncharacterized protein n=1 Tax=Pleuronectes platessa TaxID=8262 RepID=A0A9N7TL49_PLEPL|nr:unnamed protein product [Pleuronectes platessa]